MDSGNPSNQQEMAGTGSDGFRVSVDRDWRRLKESVGEIGSSYLPDRVDCQQGRPVNDLAIGNKTAMTEVHVESPVPDRRRKFLQESAFFLTMLLAGTAAQLEFSWMGFSPTDEGWILSFSRRILAGQVPHRDYFRVQTPGSEFFHAPEVLFGGDYTFWISRFVAWIQIALIAWAWPQILSRLMRKELAFWHKILLGLICFAFTAGTFPVMAWPTFDGLFFVTFGLLLVLRQNSLPKFCGYFLIGISIVCKQNFVVVFPAYLFLLGDWRKIRYWVASILPCALYLGSMLALGAMPDLLIQVGSARGFVARGIEPFLMRKEVFASIAIGMLATVFVNERKFKALEVGNLLAYTTLFLGAGALSIESRLYSDTVSFGIFGLALGAALAHLFFKSGNKQAAIAGLLTVVLAWGATISNGFNFPTLACGILVVFLLQVVFADFGSFHGHRFVSSLTLGLLTLVTLVAFCVGRYHHIYRDLAANELTARLDGVLPGGRLLRTNPNTFAFLSDLNLAISETHGTPYAIIPGFSAYWVKGPQLDPVPIDWPYQEMLPNPKMIVQFQQSIADQKGKIILIVEKVEPTDLRDGFEPLNEPIYPQSVLSYVRSNFAKVGETKYFELRR